MLLCLISCRRVSDVRALDLAGRMISPQWVSFVISRLTKSLSQSVEYPAFPHNNKLCVLQYLKVYEERTLARRTDPLGQLLISIQKPFRPVAAATLARWVKSEAGIDVSIYVAHSARGAMASKAYTLGSRLEDILRAADWSSDSMFKMFYYKPIAHVSSVVIDEF